MTKVIEATNPDGNMENSPNACPCKYKENKTDFVRAVLCALLISMLFSFVASNVTLEKTAPAADSLCAAFKLAFSCIVDFVKELSQLASTRTGRHVLFARVWIVFYFGYLLDDYLQICEAPSDSGKWHRKCITGAWTFFLGQAFTIWCMKLSAVFITH